MSQLSIVPNASSSAPRSVAFEDPLELRRREVGVGNETGPGTDQLRGKGPATLRCAAVLPDDRVVDRTSRPSLPDDRGLALVGDSNGAQLGRADSCVSECGLGSHADAREDLLGIVLDPARLREELCDLLVATAPWPELVVDDEAGRACRPLIDGQDHRRCPASTFPSRPSVRRGACRPRAAPRERPVPRGSDPGGPRGSSAGAHTCPRPAPAACLRSTPRWIPPDRSGT